FDEKTGKFLWQAVFDKLGGGQAVDWPLQGICSSAVVEGDRLWFVNNRCEVVCADVNGDPKTQGVKMVWKLEMIDKLGVTPHNLASCPPLIVGTRLFLVTANGVDKGHINIPSPKAPSFLCLDKEKGTVLWQKNNPSAALVETDTPIKMLLDRG